MSFHGPSTWWLLVLLAVPLFWWRWWSPSRRAAMLFSSVALARSAGASWVVRIRWIVPLLRTAAVVLLAICLARPRQADEHTRVFSEGVAIELIVDRSGSMKAMDFELKGGPTSRLDVVKMVVDQFVHGGGDLPGRPDDLIGLIAFAGFADSACPLTLDHDHLRSAVEATDFAINRSEDGTAIGDAIALGVERLGGLDVRGGTSDRTPIKSRVMILLTDGENNAGDIDPVTAARMAAAFDIRIYTIGAGTDKGFAPMPYRDAFGRTGFQQVAVSIDEDTLRAIADTTGGRYFRATDTDSLTEIYAQIDELERTEFEQRRYTDYHELAVETVALGRFTLPPLLAIVLVLLALELLLANTRFRTLP